MPAASADVGATTSGETVLAGSVVNGGVVEAVRSAVSGGTADNPSDWVPHAAVHPRTNATRVALAPILTRRREDWLPLISALPVDGDVASVQVGNLRNIKMT